MSTFSRPDVPDPPMFDEQQASERLIARALLTGSKQAIDALWQVQAHTVERFVRGYFPDEASCRATLSRLEKTFALLFKTYDVHAPSVRSWTLRISYDLIKPALSYPYDLDLASIMQEDLGIPEAERTALLETTPNVSPAVRRAVALTLLGLREQEIAYVLEVTMQTLSVYLSHAQIALGTKGPSYARSFLRRRARNRSL